MKDKIDFDFYSRLCGLIAQTKLKFMEIKISLNFDLENTLIKRKLTEIKIKDLKLNQKFGF